MKNPKVYLSRKLLPRRAESIRLNVDSTIRASLKDTVQLPTLELEQKQKHASSDLFHKTGLKHGQTENPSPEALLSGGAVGHENGAVLRELP